MDVVTRYKQEIKQIHDKYDLSIIDLKKFIETMECLNAAVKNRNVRYFLEDLGTLTNWECIRLCQYIEQNYFVQDEPILMADSFIEYFDITKESQILIFEYMGLKTEEYFSVDQRHGLSWYDEDEAAELARDRIMKYIISFLDVDDIVLIAEDELLCCMEYKD